MASARLLAAVMAVLLLTITVAGAYGQIAARDADPRNAIVNESIRVILNHLGSHYELLTRNGTITILVNEQTRGVTLPETLKGHPVHLLDEAAIAEKTHREGAFLYLVFSELTTYPDGTALVRFRLTGVFDTGAGGSIRLTQHDGIWFGEGGAYWIA